MKRSLLSVLAAVLMLAVTSSTLAQESGWPRTLPLDQGTMTIYSPQIDEMSDDVIYFRAALAYRATPGAEPVFGAGWFESRVEIDRSAGIVHARELKVTDTRFPADADDVEAELSSLLAQQSPEWNFDFSVSELETALKTAEAESRAAQKLNTTPPKIIYRDHPALLITMDGDPVLREIEDSTLQAVINTPYPLIYDGSHYYLNAAKDVWYRAARATGPYQFEASPPADIAAMIDDGEAVASDDQPIEPVTAANAPEIVVSTEPAELIVTEGPAAFLPLVDDLLVLKNSDSDVFMHVSEQKYFIVLAGRWYNAASLNGPWAWQPADGLPEAFARIPLDSDQAESRVYVAGTAEAREAVLDAQVPQTTAVARGEADIDVVYDGKPVFKPVDGTDLVYIENTGSTVILANGWYYLVEDGVWYVSSSPNGPWQVSDHRPAQVETILPTSPVYNTKYVRIYDSTPQVVYVGYTPGYFGSYVYSNTIFYGSGWYYSPWVSPYYYYPRPRTWGFGVAYNPWTGWGFGLSWGWGPFYVNYYSGGYWHRNHYWHHRHYGYWGPRGYRPRPVHHDYRGDGHRQYANRGDGRDGRNGRDGRDQAGRVRPSDLSSKANQRDINARESKRSLTAQSRGDINRGGSRSSGRNEAVSRNEMVSRSSLLAKSVQSPGITPSTNREQDGDRSSGRSKSKDTFFRSTQPVTGTTYRQEENRTADAPASRRPAPPAKSSPDRQTQPVGNSGRTFPVSNDTRPLSDNISTRGDDIRTVSRGEKNAAPRSITPPPQRQIEASPRTERRSAPTVVSGYAAPAQRAPKIPDSRGGSRPEPVQRAVDRGSSGSQRTGSSVRAGNHSGSNRSKRQ